ncbi:MAG: RDD family protein [Paludibacteraceae bacterium]|nr:RDD family protein [Paludibacteraceae bacterium]
MIDSLNITNGQYVQLNYQIAGTEKRVFAVIVDRCIQFILYWMLFKFLDSVSFRYFFSGFFREFIIIVSIFIVYLINLMQEIFLHGKTIGKYLFKIKVITEQSEPPSFQQCFIRWILYPIDALIIGMVMISKHGQRIGDMASGCYVVFDERSKVVKASIETDYQYIKENYKPEYEEEELRGMKEKDIQLILKGLYNVKYVSQINDVASIICKKYNLTKRNMSAREFLVRLYNDYKYYELNREQ